MNKLIRYRLSVSVKFPASHPRKGEPTEFIEKIEYALKFREWTGLPFPPFNPKIHTIRSNYNLWQKRFEKINKCEAVLELYYWSGKPYNSKCITICQLGKDDGIGIQKIMFPFPNLHCFKIDEIEHQDMSLSKNDGLSYDDFKAWFKGYNLSEPLAIIHFTKFRY